MGERSIDGSIRDITKRKLAEEALKLSEDKMRMLVEGTPYLFFYTQDAEANMTYVSPSVKEITGHTVEEWIGQRHWFTTKSEINKIARERTAAHLRGEITKGSILVEIKHAEGQNILLEVYEKPIFRNNKVEGLQGVAHDITARIMAEEKLKESETRYRSLIENAPTAIAISRELKFIYANPTFLKLYEYDSADELIGKPLSIAVSPKSLNEFMQRAKNRELGNTELSEYEAAALKKDGSEFYVHASVTRIDLHDGPATLGFFYDITEKVKAEIEIKKGIVLDNGRAK